jgi:hypothetical protein
MKTVSERTPKTKCNARVQHASCTHSGLTGQSWPLAVRLIHCLIACIVVNMGHGQDSKPATSSITLKGVSSGGILTLMKAPSLNYPFVAVTNEVGDSAAMVTEKLAHQLRERGDDLKVLRTNDFLKLILGGGPVGTSGLYGTWILGGTDRGFNIPPPPTAASASFDTATDSVTIRWINPPEGYDSIVVVYYGDALAILPGDATQCVHRRRPAMDAGFSSTDIPIFVLGYKDGVPSNGVGVRVRNHNQQESLMNVPFTTGTAPGFETWAHDTTTNHIQFTQGNLPRMHSGTDTRKFNGKGFYQIIKGEGSVQGGVARRFVGLTPGHTYRVSARLNVLEAVGDNWIFSFHASANAPGKSNLSDAQLAGYDELPKGLKGKTAAQIARFDSASTTKGQWVTSASNEARDDNTAGDISLPVGSDSISVWFRLEASGVSKATAGIDSLTIEDLGSKQ